MPIDPARNQAFKDLAVKVRQRLIGQGHDVVPQVVTDLLLAAIDTVARQLQVTQRTAMGYIEPQTVAESIANAAKKRMHGLRSHRYGRRVELPGWISGAAVAALGQVVKYAVSNQDGQAADHAADLLSEIGFALSDSNGADTITTAQEVWSEAATLMEKAADQIKAGDWVLCRCPDPGCSAALDAAVPGRLRRDADLARKIADSVQAPPPLQPVPPG